MMAQSIGQIGSCQYYSHVLNGEALASWILHAIILGIQAGASKFSGNSFSYFNRSLNVDSHKLVELGIWENPSYLFLLEVEHDFSSSVL